MSDLPSYTSVFSSHSDGRITKRNRRPVSCSTCRAKKSKCDRQQPCNSCCKRGEAAFCDYNAAHPKQDTRTRSEASNRLQKLEEMVNGLIKANVNLPPVITPPDSSEDNQESPDSGSLKHPDVSAGGHLHRRGSQVNYIGATHWASVLESIHGIRAFLDSDDNSPPLQPVPEPVPRMKRDPLFESQSPLTIEMVLDVLPPRRTVDNLLASYFKEKFITLPFIHSFKFHREYEAFWNCPSQTSFLWLSILFSILFSASRVLSAKGQAAAFQLNDLVASSFLTKAGECLSAGQYLKAQPYSVEALLCYVHGIYALHGDPDIPSWPILSMATRLAQKMGYHRDPRYLSDSVTPFEGEMRRRAWYYIEIFDLTMSAQQGMPAIINEDECDCQDPTNLLDEDFDEMSVVLPSPRPDSAETPLSFFSYKAKIVRQLRPIIRHALSNRRHDLEETKKLHDSLEALHDNIPVHLRIRPVRSSSFGDQDDLIINRVMIELQYLKGMCILHRTFLTYKKDDPTFEPFRKTCTRAALKMLDLQVEYYQELQPGGRLFENNWMFTKITLHEFFAAAMIVCLDLSERAGCRGLRLRKLESLQNSYHVWSENAGLYKDAAHASQVLAAMITKLSSREPQQALSEKFTNLSSAEEPSDSIGLPGLTPSHVSQDMDSFPSGPNTIQNEPYDLMDFGSLENILDDHDNVDWNTIDHYLIDYTANTDQPLDLHQF